MPYFSIETNKVMDEKATSHLLKKASGFVAGMLGKPESYVMVSIKPDTPMMFGGSSLPLAFITLKSIGLPQDRCGDFAKRICEFVETELEIAPDRVFIDFTDLDRQRFGWNGKTF
jgi:phenylpyruvate tautomerase PptA (4-oxalocrotonate tautomerase family)